MSRPRVLLALTVYNGGDVVAAALESVARLDTAVADVDVLVLDDCSPEPGFSEQIERHCERLGHQYYRSPRNLGIPRNVNLGLLAAIDGDYDHVIISNSDVVYSRCSVDQLVLTAQTDSRIGSVTAWSTNVSIYSIPNAAPNDHLPDQATTDEVGAALRSHFGATAVDIPAGISFAMLIPVPVLRVVGIMDPIFGRGYCEETDWSRRSLAAGFRLTLGIGAFVYHRGGASNEPAGLLGAGESTVPANERIIDLKYPTFRDEVAEFGATGTMGRLHLEAIGAIIGAASERHGHRVSVGLCPPRPVDSSQSGPDGDRPVSIDVRLDGPGRGHAQATIEFAGFRSTHAAGHQEAADTLRNVYGVPRSVDVYDIGVPPEQFARSIAGDDEALITNHRNYPAHV